MRDTYGNTVRYIGELHSPNYAVHTRKYLSIRHAMEDLRDLYCGCAEDQLVLWHASPYDSDGEAYGRTYVRVDAWGILERGPRGGIRKVDVR